MGSGGHPRNRTKSSSSRLPMTTELHMPRLLSSFLAKSASSGAKDCNERTTRGLTERGRFEAISHARPADFFAPRSDSTLNITGALLDLSTWACAGITRPTFCMLHWEKKNGRATLAQTSCAKFRTFHQSNAILCPSFSDTLKRQPRIEKINVHRLHV